MSVGLGLRLPPALLAEPHLLGESRSRRSVVWRHHRIVCRKTPLFAVLLGRQVIVGAQMPFERLELLPVLKANNVVREDRALGIDGGLQRLGFRLGGAGMSAAQRPMNFGD